MLVTNAHIYHSPIGAILIEADDQSIARLEFVRGSCINRF
jgi:hypothetical protein